MPAVRYNRLLSLFWRLHRSIYKITSGRIGARIAGIPVLLLTTTGRKSGERRDNTLYYFSDRDRYIVIASNAGRGPNPGWFYNLKARPQAIVLVGGREFPVIASVAAGEERQRLWAETLRVDANYGEYQDRTDREIPVVILTPG